jgi:hypothetical protein
MSLKSRRRSHRRRYRVPITFSDYNSDDFNDARVFNQSSNGLCFKTSRNLPTGTDIYINMPGPKKGNQYTEAGVVRRARVRWCRKIDSSTYNIGVNFSEPLIKQIRRQGLAKEMPFGLWEMDSTDFS